MMDMLWWIKLVAMYGLWTIEIFNSDRPEGNGPFGGGGGGSW